MIDEDEEERRSARIYRRIAGASQAYQQGHGGLWTDPELQLALNWREEFRPTAEWAQAYDPAFERAMIFLDESLRGREQELEMRERRRRQEFRRMRVLAIVTSVVALAFALLGLYALEQNRQALAAKEEAAAEHQLELAARDEMLLAKVDAERQRQNALEAVLDLTVRSVPQGSEVAVLRGLADGSEVRFYQILQSKNSRSSTLVEGCVLHLSRPLVAIRFSPDGRLTADAPDGTVIQWHSPQSSDPFICPGAVP